MTKPQIKALSITIAKQKDGYKIDGINKGYCFVEPELMSWLLKENGEAGLYPYRLTCCVYNYDANEWYCQFDDFYPAKK